MCFKFSGTHDHPDSSLHSQVTLPSIAEIIPIQPAQQVFNPLAGPLLGRLVVRKDFEAQVGPVFMDRKDACQQTEIQAVPDMPAGGGPLVSQVLEVPVIQTVLLYYCPLILKCKPPLSQKARSMGGASIGKRRLLKVFFL